MSSVPTGLAIHVTVNLLNHSTSRLSGLLRSSDQSMLLRKSAGFSYIAAHSLQSHPVSVQKARRWIDLNCYTLPVPKFSRLPVWRSALCIQVAIIKNNFLMWLSLHESTMWPTKTFIVEDDTSRRDNVELEGIMCGNTSHTLRFLIRTISKISITEIYFQKEH